MTCYLQVEEVTVLHVLEVRDIGFQTRGVIKLTDPRLCSLSLEIEGTASWLRPAGLTTPNDSRGRQVLDIVVEQTAGRDMFGSIS